MNKTSARIAKKISLPNAASLLVGTMLLAQLLGFFRTKLINANFELVGVESTDIYFAAFKIPDFFFYVLAAGVLGDEQVRSKGYLVNLKQFDELYGDYNVCRG